jgi:hypothetical protein
MKNFAAALLPLAALLASPALAQSSKPVTQRDVKAVDVVATPATDLNLRKDQIPPLLLAAEDRPYDLAGLGNCRRLSASVRELDAVLGEDIDLPSAEKRTSAGRIAQAGIRAFIPFGGLIREVSGANGHERRMQEVILAGMARRSFLKGVGQVRGCTYPARSATPQIVAAQEAAIASAANSRERRKAED